MRAFLWYLSNLSDISLISCFLEVYSHSAWLLLNFKHKWWWINFACLPLSLRCEEFENEPPLILSQPWWKMLELTWCGILSFCKLSSTHLIFTFTGFSLLSSTLLWWWTPSIHFMDEGSTMNNFCLGLGTYKQSNSIQITFEQRLI